MVKIGDAYVDLSAVDAIVPMRGVMDGFSVYLSSGRFFDLPGLTEGEVEQVLVKAGVISVDNESGKLLIQALDFSGEEFAELTNAMAQGFLYLAKDSSGQVYAYSEEPRKGKESWINDDSVSRTQRMRAGSYDAVSFDNVMPFFIPALFEEVVE